MKHMMKHGRVAFAPRALALALCLVGAPSAFGFTPAHLWSQRFGGTYDDYGLSTAVDASGNVVMVGRFGGTVNFGGGDLVNPSSSPDIFVAKYNSNGVHQWSKRFGNTLDDYGSGVAVDASGNVFVTGYCRLTVNFGGSDLVSAGNDADMFVAKFNANGVHQWSQRFGGTGIDLGQGLAVDASGNVFVTGIFQGTANFGGSDLVSAGYFDIFAAKYSAAGVHQWSKRFGSSTNSDYGYSVAADAAGNVVATGYFWGTANFGGSDLVSAGNYDIYVAKYNTSGVHQWSERFGGTSDDEAYGIAIDGSGNVLVTGWFGGTANFGGGNLVSSSGSAIFVAKYNASGAHQWSQGFGGAGYYDQGWSARFDGSGHAFATGWFQGTVNFGGDNLVSAGGNDIYVAEFDASGAHQWSQRFGGTGDDRGYSIALDGSGNMRVTGEMQGTVNFGGSDLVSAGGADIFLAKFGQNPMQPFITAITDIGNDQGRKVKIRFGSSTLDAVASPTPILRYVAFRRDDLAPPPAFSAHGPAGLPERALRDAGWIEVESVGAFTKSSYGIDVPTLGDSTVAHGQYYSVFFIRATTATPGTFFDSPTDSGYSLDNLAPGVPASFAYGSGILTWNKSTAEDFDYFTVYGSNSNCFCAATAIDYTASPTMNVNTSPYAFYYVTATDLSGNESKPATINALTGAGGTPKGYVLSISSYPNPFNPSTTIRYTVPSKGNVTVAIYDARGAHVATLVHEDRDAGAYTERWDGRDASGRAVSSGVYFACVNHPTGTRSYKTVLLK